MLDFIFIVSNQIKQIMKSIYLQFLVFLFLIILCVRSTKGYNSTETDANKLVKCISREKQALLKLKAGLVDYHNQLSSWGSSKEIDCCKWSRVRCNEKSGHIDVLDLRPVVNSDSHWINLGVSSSYINASFRPDNPFTAFGGEINSSLLELQHLKYLDLSMFGGTLDLKLVASLKNLRYLNISRCDLKGSIPYQLGNLTRLVSLDLSYNKFENDRSLMWLSLLPNLKYLDMSTSNLSKAMDLFQAINSLPSLVNLLLWGCELISNLPSTPPPLSYVNSSKSLAAIDLSMNGLTSSVFPWLFNFNNSLVHLDLFQNDLQGPIPDAIGAMTSLNYLDLGSNHLEGEIPRALGNLSRLETMSLIYNNLSGELPSLVNSFSLKELYLSSNKLNGSLPDSIWLLSNLEVLDIFTNFMSGVISDIHFSNLTKLRYLVISSNSFTLNLSSEWVPPFQLEILGMGSCKLGPHFPQWLRTQKRIFDIDVSNSGISDVIGSWFWELPLKLLYLDLSGNQLRGEVQKLSFIMDDFSTVDLSSNRFHGPIPLLPPNVTQLILAKNMFSGTALNICSITGQELIYLDLSDNFLTGELPDCWTHWKALKILNLANNNFSGSIPASFGSLHQIQTLHMRNNSFSGELPPSLGNCKLLELLDVGENKLSGEIPEWMGKNVLKLIFLRLRSNHFYGIVPLHLCHLPLIQILDLSHNNLSGGMPWCLSNFTAMATTGGEIEISSHDVPYPITYDMSYVIPFLDNVLVVWKGMELDYSKTLGLVKSLDLSSNNLSGEIPSGIISLLGLVALNLSHNQLTGIIPDRIGQLKSLQSLDLSVNRLVGGVPESLRDLTYLSHLNLSFNNLSGKIPLGTQLQSFDNTSFIGNRALCGEPLPNVCPGEEDDHFPFINQGSKKDGVSDDKDGFMSRGFYVSMGLGFATGFWAICGTLLLKRSWRHAYFRFLDNIERWLYVTAALNMAKLRTRLCF